MEETDERRGLGEEQAADTAPPGPGGSGGTAAEARRLAQAGEWTALFVLVARLTALRKAFRPDSEEYDEFESIALTALAANKDRIIGGTRGSRAGLAFTVALTAVNDHIRGLIQERRARARLATAADAGELDHLPDMDAHDEWMLGRDTPQVSGGTEDGKDAEPRLARHSARELRRQQRQVSGRIRDNPLQLALKHEQSETLWRAVAELPTRQRQAVRLAYLRELTYKEIARQMGCRLGTVGALLSAARKKLIKKIEDIGHSYYRGTRGNGEPSLF